MTLCDLKPGESGVLTGCATQTARTLRLMEMGFTPGTEVSLVGTGPGGDPMLLRLRGYTFTLACREAAQMTIRQGAMS